MYGKHPSEETRKKMSAAQRARPEPSKETREKLSTKAKERGYKGPIGKLHHKSKQVARLDPITKEILEVYDNIKQASHSLGCFKKSGYTSIGRSCKGRVKALNYHWKYVQ